MGLQDRQYLSFDGLQQLTNPCLGLANDPSQPGTVLVSALKVPHPMKLYSLRQTRRGSVTIHTFVLKATLTGAMMSLALTWLNVLIQNLNEAVDLNGKSVDDTEL